MTKTKFKEWQENGNFTLSQDRILEVLNHISESMHSEYTKEEAAEACAYLQIENSNLINRINHIKGDIGLALISLATKTLKSEWKDE